MFYAAACATALEELPPYKLKSGSAGWTRAVAAQERTCSREAFVCQMHIADVRWATADRQVQARRSVARITLVGDACRAPFLILLE
jgi:hypothetical protein